jgi:DNA polymerase-1
VRKVLYERLQLPVHAVTAGGLASTSETAIADLKGAHPIIGELLHYRELEKLRGSYLEGWKQFIVDNFIYFSYKQSGTVTGRFSSRLHQMPTDGAIRSVISVGEDLEWEFFAADLSQAELRIAAEMSGDVSLIDAYRSGRDVHWDTVLYMIGAGHMDEYAQHALDTAQTLRPLRLNKWALSAALGIMGEEGVEKCTAVWKGWKEARTRAKRINFGFLYGMMERKFMQKGLVDYDWPCTLQQARSFRNGFFEQRSGLAPWHSRCKALARIDGYVTNLFGRMRRLPAIQSSDQEARSEAERQAVNSPVQGTIGDWKAAAMIEIHETIPHNHIRLGGEHHDALLGRVKRKYKDEALPKVRTIMQRPKLLDTFNIDMKVPMLVDVNIGPWGKGLVYRDPL